uniref:Uncharacterized protein n=1 Tax=Lepeophtheirus salmonis TaxID=72036 RepID=A0A0K2U144_LEPSM
MNKLFLLKPLSVLQVSLKVATIQGRPKGWLDPLIKGFCLYHVWKKFKCGNMGKK